MAWFLDFVKRVSTPFNSSAAPVTTESQPIKFGILGAAAIAPPALISPASTHPEVQVYAVAARDQKRAEAFAKKYGIEKAYGGSTGYQQLLDDPEVEAVYNPLPNGLHYEWTMKALAAGKHVLLEKPAASTAEETREMFKLAKSKGLILMEAFHYRFHPAVQRLKAIVDGGELGAVKHISTSLAIPKGIMGPGDIRYKYELGGGALMDMGCYTLSCLRYLSSSEPISIESATHEVYVPPSPPSDYVRNVDRRTVAELLLPKGVTGTITCDLAMPPTLGVIPKIPQISAVVKCENGEVELFNFVAPAMYHWLKVKVVDGNGKAKTRTEKAYTFEGEEKGKEWSTYRYQLEAFVDQLKGRTPQTWITKGDSVANMEWIEQIYEKTGLGSRPKSRVTS